MRFEARDTLIAIHHAATGVAPATDWLATTLAELGDDPSALDAIAGRMHRYAEAVRQQRTGALPDHSQNGELAIILRHLVRSGTRHGIIVDVGALGRKGSNSYDLLAGFGWKGLLIEANPARHEPIRLEFGDVDMTLVGCAVGLVPGRQRFFVAAHAGCSSLLEENARMFCDVREEVEVEVRRLPDILDAAAIPHDFDVLDLDIEGMDVPVMNDLVATSPYRPRLVLIEGSFFFRTEALADIGLSVQVGDLYRLADRTVANLILELR